MRPKVDRPIHHCECHVCQTGSDTALAQLHSQINLLLNRLSEPQRRWYLGSLSTDPSQPNDSDLSRITGVDRKTIRRGRRELALGLADHSSIRQRRPGGGRPRAEKKMEPS
jgi:hypothetical protein